MSSSPVNLQNDRSTGPSWAIRAFIVESVVLLAFLIASSTMFVQLASAAIQLSGKSDLTASAVAVATYTAERFAADPASVQKINQLEDVVAVCEVSSTRRAGGTLYRADIKVYESGSAGEAVAADVIAGGQHDVIYATTTAAYVSEASG